MSRINMTDTPISSPEDPQGEDRSGRPAANPEELETAGGRQSPDALRGADRHLKARGGCRFAGTQFSLLKRADRGRGRALAPIAERMNALMADTDALDAMLRDGAAKANASQTDPG